jgi:hypothetical protein
MRASARPATIVAWSLCGLAVLAGCVTVAFGIADAEAIDALPGEHRPSGGIATAVVDFLLVAGFGSVGAIVASHRPRNPVGWLLIGIPVLLSLGILGEALYWHAAVSGNEDRGAFALWFANWFWVPMVYAIFVLLPLLFPTGRPLTRHWRAVVWAAGAGGAALFVGTAFDPGPFSGFDWVENPLGVPGLPAAIGWFGMAVWGAGTIAAIVSVVLRFRRSRGAERQQLKWLTAAVPLLVVAAALSGLLEESLGEDATWAIFAGGILGVDVAIALAVMRYRLYDIDVVINRALVYGTLTATLAGSYLGGVLLLQAVLSPSSDLAVAGSTLAVAALVRPARARIQEQVDRRFYRRKYDVRNTLEAFAGRLRDEVDLDTLNAELTTVVAGTMHPAHVSLWLRKARP